MPLLTPWLLPYLLGELEQATARVQHAALECSQEGASRDPRVRRERMQQALKCEGRGLSKRVQISKITSYDENGEVPITMEVSDAHHRIDCFFTKHCVNKYNESRQTPMSSIPPITTLRGAYIILRAARLAINRTQRTPRLAVCIAVDELVFMGTNGCEPTNEVRFVEEERKVFEALVRCAGWLEPLGSGTLHPPTKPRNDCHEPAPATFRRHVSAPITTTSHFHPYSRTHNPTLADFEEAQSLPPLPASALPSAEEPSESSQELTVSTRPETAGLGTQADTQVDGRMYVGEWDLLFLSDDENDGEDGEDDGKARDDATQKRRCAKC